MYNMLMDNFSFGGDNSAAAGPAAAPAMPKKQGGKILITAIVALLVGAAIASAIFITINNLNKNGGAANSGDAKKGTTLDARLTAELAYKTNRIIANTPSAGRSVRDVDTTGQFDDYVNLSNQMRADIVVGSRMYVSEEGEEIDTANLSDSYKDKKWRINNGFKKSFIVRIDDKVKSDYKYLFGEEFTNFPETVSSDYVTGCPATYVSDGPYYVASVQCGGATDIIHSLYQYKYELDGDKAYVYFAMMAESGFSNERHTFNSGFISEGKLVSGLTDDQKYSLQEQGVGYQVYDIKTDSYIPVKDKVQHYRAVFEKGSDGDFYYKTLEKVND